MDLIFYDFDLTPCLVVRKYVSLNITLKYREYGTFEAHFPPNNAKLITLLKDNRYLICGFGDITAIVTSWQIEDDIAVFAKTPEWLMTKRGLAPLNRTAELPEATARYAVSTAMSDFVTLDSAVNKGTAQAFSTSGAKTVYDIVTSALTGTNLGFRLCADIKAKKFVFSVYGGTEKTVMLSQSNKTAYDMTYTNEIQDMATGGVWFEKKTTDKDGNETTEWAQTAAGTETGAKRWEAVLSGTKTADEAQKEADAKAAKESISCLVRSLEYGKDYALGDTLRVQFEKHGFKRTLKNTVTGVEISCDSKGQETRPILESEG